MISRTFVLLVYLVLLPFSAISLLTVLPMIPIALIYWICSGEEEKAMELTLFFPFKMADLFFYITDNW